jgi:hypothetical protein
MSLVFSCVYLKEFAVRSLLSFMIHNTLLEPVAVLWVSNFVLVRQDATEHDMSIRLNGGRTSEEGRVEVKFGDSGQQTEISRVLQQKSFRPMARLNINPLK